MKVILFLGVIASLAGLDGSDKRSLELADKMMTAMGGQKALDAIQYLRFDFVVRVKGKEASRHRHLWDKWHGRYRLEGRLRDGKSYCIAFADINRKSGWAYIDGKKVDGDDERTRLTYGYRRFINDTYWLLMPWKLKDPGVNLTYEGVQKDSATQKDFDVVHLTFDHVGLTPKDHYWAFINSSTHLMERWKFSLPQDSGAAETGDYYWKEWQDVGSVRFAFDKMAADGEDEIRTENVQEFRTVNDSVFADPNFPLP